MIWNAVSFRNTLREETGETCDLNKTKGTTWRDKHRAAMSIAMSIFDECYPR